MGISTQALHNTFISVATDFPQELVTRRYPAEPKPFEGETPITIALLVSYHNFLSTYARIGLVQGFDVIERMQEVVTPAGIQDEEGAIWQNFFGQSLYHNEGVPTPLPVQADMATDLLIGFSVWNVLESKRKFQDEADLLVQVGAEINGHLSQLHYGNDFAYNNVSKQMYDYFLSSPERLAVFSQQLTKKVEALGINPLVVNTRMHYDAETRDLSWCFFDSGGKGEYTVQYNPNGDQPVCAVCGIDGSGKSTLLSKLGRVVLPIAHPDAPVMIKFLTVKGTGIVDYSYELSLFEKMRASALKKDLTLTAFRFVRSIIALIEEKNGLFTIFQNIVLDRSGLTNIAYVNRARDFGEAVGEFMKDHFLNPHKIAVIDMPVSSAYYHATRVRPGADDFDTASFSTYISRASMYRILAKVLPNVVLFSTYNAETEELEPIEVLAKRLKRVLYGD